MQLSIFNSGVDVVTLAVVRSVKQLILAQKP